MPHYMHTFLYVDDTTLVTSDNTINEIADQLNTAMGMAASWFRNHKLSLNVSKTKLMVMGTTRRLRECNVMPPAKMNNETECMSTTNRYTIEAFMIGICLSLQEWYQYTFHPNGKLH